MNPAFDVEHQLHLHGRALRGLACDLLRCGQAADDATQEVWVQALRSGPRHTAAPGGWLRTVLVNVVARLRRGERRRARHEAFAADGHDVVAEDHAAVLARQEIAQRLMVAVRALEPRYSDVIWARFFEDRTPHEIAAARGEPVATVKSRLQRGLGILRERLGEGADGARGDWRAALATAFGLKETTTAASSAAIVGGGVLVAMWTKGLVVAAAVALAAVCWWPRDAAPPARAEVVRGVAAAPDPAATGGEVPAPVAIAPPEGVREAVEPVAAAARTSMAVLRGRCVDAAGAPMVGCVVALRGSSPSGARMDAWLRDHPDPRWLDPEPVTTAADGAFSIAFEPPPPLRFALTINAAGMVPMHGNWRTIAAGREVALGDVVMQPRCALRVRVVESDGGPCLDAQCRVENEIRTADAEGLVRPGATLSATSSADGHAEFPALVAGRYSVHATDGVRESERRVVSIGEGPETELTLLLPGPRPLSITGRVVDEQGAAVRNARILFRAGRPVSTRGDGAFRLLRPAGDTNDATTMEVTAEGFAWLAVADPIAWGSTEVELQMRRIEGLTLSVRDPDGALVLDYTVRCQPVQEGGTRLRTSQDQRVRARGPFPDGVAFVPGVGGGSWRLVLEFPTGSKLPTWIDDVLVPAEGGRFDVQLPTLARRTIRVVTRTGEPVVETQVQLILPHTDSRVRGLGWVMPTERSLASSGPISRIVCEGTTDARGQCEVQGPPGRGYVVRVLGPGHAPRAVESVALDVADELTVEVSRGARLIGRIIPADALAQLGQYGDAKDERYPQVQPVLRLKAENGEARFSTFTSARDVDHPGVVVAPDGSYVCDGQLAGTSRIVVEYMRAFGSGSTRDSVTLGTIELADGQETRRDLDLGWLMPAWLEAEVMWNGERFANATVLLESTLQNADGTPQVWSSMPQRTDANGAFRMMVRPGTFEVVLQADADGHDTPPLRCPVAAIVAAGRTMAHVFEIASGRLDLTILDAEGKPAAGVVVFAGDARRTLPATDAAGRTTGEIVAGTWALRLLPKELEGKALAPYAFPMGRDEDPYAGKWLELGIAVVAPRQTAKQELRLPPTFAK